jgi:hypothetical protein
VYGLEKEKGLKSKKSEIGGYSISVSDVDQLEPQE